MAQVIDFSRLGGPVYAGRSHGALARQRLSVDALDALKEPVRVLIPDRTYAVTSSFFRGLFGPSLARFESRAAFLQHYRFEGSRDILEIIRLSIERLLATRGKLTIG